MGSHWYYVSERDLNEHRLFLQICRSKRITPSQLIAQWRKRWLLEQMKDVTPETSKSEQKALESYLTSERDTLKERSKKLDEEYLRSKKK